MMINCRPATDDDLAAVAQVFFVAFADSVEHASARPAAADAIEDLFGIALAAEPGSLVVANRAGQVVGYILATADVKRLRRAAFWRAHWLRPLWRALTGRYKLSLPTLHTVVGDKLAFLRGGRLCGAHQARLLSLAVHPDYQGGGIGRELVSAGLEYLHDKGVRQIRIEVRPDNAPALHLYKSFGFQTCGEYCDSQGKWSIMVKESGEV